LRYLADLAFELAHFVAESSRKEFVLGGNELVLRGRQAFHEQPRPILVPMQLIQQRCLLVQEITMRMDW
jgi:hypothetical protein